MSDIKLELEQVYRTAGVGLCVLDRQMRFVRINEKLASYNDLPVEAHIGRPFPELLPGLARLTREIDRVFETGVPVLRKQASARPPGSRDVTRHFVYSIHPLRDSQGHTDRVSVVVADATDWKVADDARRELLDFEQLVSKLSKAIISIDTSLDQALNRGLDAVREFFDVDVAYIQRFQDEGRLLRPTHGSIAPGVTLSPTEEFNLEEKTPWVADQMIRGLPFIFSNVGELGDEAARERSLALSTNIRSGMTLPLRAGEDVLGAIGLSLIRSERNWSAATQERLEVIAGIVANALARQRGFVRQRLELTTAQQDRRRLERSITEAPDSGSLESVEIVSQNRAMRDVLAEVRQLARSDEPVLLVGEPGSGRERLARWMHQQGPRAQRPLVHVNCAALHATLLDSELFGRERGAYSGSMTAQVGRFEVAHGSTILLDEVAELPLELQAKLLLLIEHGKLQRLEGTDPIEVDVRIVASTTANLANAVADGRFLEELYLRLNSNRITLPPLRDRPEDVSGLVWSFVREFEAKMGKRIEEISAHDIETLQSHSWTGNLRELRNVVERAMILSSGRRLALDWFDGSESGGAEARTLAEVQRRHILRVLEATHWRVRGRAGAAEVLGLKPTTLEARMAKLGVRRPR